jgi:hypothetical protein
MARVVAGLAAYNKACARRQELLRQAVAFAEVVKNGATMLEQDPARWRFGNSALGLKSRSRRCIDGGVVIINPATWPGVGDLVRLQQEYLRAVALESAARAVLPPSWNSPSQR